MGGKLIGIKILVQDLPARKNKTNTNVSAKVSVLDNGCTNEISYETQHSRTHRTILSDENNITQQEWQ